MSTNILLPKKCQYCGTMFIAKTTTTRYCSHKCNSRHYKQLIKEKKLQQAFDKEAQFTTTAKQTPQQPINPTASPKEFYSIKETAQLLGVHERTIMNLIWKNKLPHLRVGRRILIDKTGIVNLFTI